MKNNSVNMKIGSKINLIGLLAGNNGVMALASFGKNISAILSKELDYPVCKNTNVPEDVEEVHLPTWEERLEDYLSKHPLPEKDARVLPITKSILHGDLHPYHIAMTVPTEKQSLIMRLLRYTADRGSLKDMEKDIVQALGDHTKVEETYHHDTTLKKDIEVLRRSTDSCAYTRVFKYILTDVLDSPPISTPTLKLYKHILKLEKQRTIMALIDLHTVMKNDNCICSVAKRFLREIKTFRMYVKASQQVGMDESVVTLLQNMLTELYFSIVHTFSPILYANDACDFEDDFEDFVYYGKRAYPSEDEKDKYEEKKRAIQKENAELRHHADEEEEKEEGAKHPKTKAEKFLEGVQKYDFLEMPPIKALDPTNENKRREKALRLVECMLKHPAHAAAMLDYLKLFEWIKNKYETNFTHGKYDCLCTTLILKKSGNSFRNYRISLNPNCKMGDMYRAWTYKETVKDEYQAVRNDLPMSKAS